MNNQTKNTFKVTRKPLDFIFFWTLTKTHLKQLLKFCKSLLGKKILSCSFLNKVKPSIDYSRNYLVNVLQIEKSI
jgi:hypothetical protein